MDAVLITLAGDEDRYVSAQHQCAAAGIWPRTILGAKTRICKQGCFLSHKKIWDTTTRTPLLVLEDDVAFADPKTFLDVITKCIRACEKHVGVLMLGSSPLRPPEGRTDPVFTVAPGNIKGTHAYVILNQQGLAQLRALPADLFPDRAIGVHMPAGTVAHSSKTLAYQRYGFNRTEGVSEQNLLRYREVHFGEDCTRIRACQRVRPA